MNLASIDLNLLLVFDAVMRERNVTRAGERIGLSQPAVSNALGRLRYHLKDELFIRSPEGMKATPRALELAEPVREALHHLEEALDPASFDPATSTRSFRIAAIDYALAVLVPIVVDRFAQHAPAIDLRFLPVLGPVLPQLDAHEVDFAITLVPDLPERFDSFVLGEDDYVILMRMGHPLATGEITLERFAAANHLLVSARGDDRGFVDEALEKKGLKRRVAMSVPQFSVTPSIIAASDMVLTAPRRLAQTFAQAYDLCLRPAPVPGPPLFSKSQLIWHRRLASHPAHDWFREEIRALIPGPSLT